MRPGDRQLFQRIDLALISFHQEQRQLPGIRESAARHAFLEQVLESSGRVRYIEVMRGRRVSCRCSDPTDAMFDPLKAALLHQHEGTIDEAFWLVFLFVHFGKHARTGYRYAREVYGRCGESGLWDWATVSGDPGGFREWLDAHQGALRPRGGFGNHRKRESLNAYSRRGTGSAVETYVRWVAPPRTHQQIVDRVVRQANGEPREAFDTLYESMNTVVTFGRTARFDYFSMIGKLGLAPIEPGSTYMKGSTGPIYGARLLFGGSKEANLNAGELEQWIVDLEAHLNLGRFGMQVIEDALCNWQKSPDNFIPFRG